MKYKVQFSEAAAEDLERLFDFALERELSSESGDLDVPGRALQAIKDAMPCCDRRPLLAERSGAALSFVNLLSPSGVQATWRCLK